MCLFFRRVKLIPASDEHTRSRTLDSSSDNDSYDTPSQILKELNKPSDFPWDKKKTEAPAPAKVVEFPWEKPRSQPVVPVKTSDLYGEGPQTAMKTVIEIPGTTLHNDGYAYEPVRTQAEVDEDLKELLKGSENIEVEIDMADSIVPGFREGLTLLPHQIVARKWMKERETGKKSGGILADDMGYVQPVCFYLSAHLWIVSAKPFKRWLVS